MLTKEYKTLVVSPLSYHYGEHKLSESLEDGWEIKHSIENMDIDICDTSSHNKRTVKGCLIILERPKNG